MKYLKKIMVIISAAVMLTSATVFADGDYTFDQSFCENYKTKEMPIFSDMPTLTDELDMLVRLNIIQGYDDDTLKLDNVITRAEAVKMLVYTIENEVGISGIETNYTKEGIKAAMEVYAASGMTFEYNGFPDVPMENWYHPYVYYAVNLLQLINGYEDGTFRPENEITEIELLTMTLRGLGYEQMIEAEGGYPEGVLSINNRLKLVDNPSNVPATRERAAKIFYNALNSHIVTISGFIIPNDNGGFEVGYEHNNTLLENRKLFTVHGTLKKSDLLSEKAIVFTPADDFEYTGSFGYTFKLTKGEDYTFTKEFTDIPEGEYDVYLYDSTNYEGEENILVTAVR